jgi:hypothetical protein
MGCGKRKMATDLLKPRRGGFLRAFGCGEFIRGYLAGNAPYGARAIDSSSGACQADIFYEYKMALIRETAMDRAVRLEEKQAKREKRPINPERIQSLSEKLVKRLPYKSHGCRYSSFVRYFSMLQRLGWVEPTGHEETSAFQQNYVEGQPRRYYRLTPAGLAAPSEAWANPQRALGPR